MLNIIENVKKALLGYVGLAGGVNSDGNAAGYVIAEIIRMSYADHPSTFYDYGGEQSITDTTDNAIVFTSSPKKMRPYNILMIQNTSDTDAVTLQLSLNGNAAGDFGPATRDAQIEGCASTTLIEPGEVGIWRGKASAFQVRRDGTSDDASFIYVLGVE